MLGRELNKPLGHLALCDVFFSCRSFPLGSPQRGNRTLVDKALESFGVSIPLIEFREIQSRCSDSSGGVDSNDRHSNSEGTTETKVLGGDGDDNDEEESESTNINTQGKGSQRDKIVTPLHKVHPHVITRCVLPFAI